MTDLTVHRSPASPAASEAGARAEPAVALRDVFCVHRTDHGDAAALQGLTLSVDRGERLCVLGPSGAGKTTLLRVIAGLQRPSAGSVRVFGDDVGRARERHVARLRHASIGFLHQHAESAISPDLPIARAVELPLALRGVARAARRARSAELLGAAGLADRTGELPGRLSGGERQRVAVCAALAHRPMLLLADEPTAELDEASAAAVAELIEALAARERATVITVSHDPELGRRAERTARIRDGRVVADGDALVVARGGWVAIGEERLRRSGIAARVRVQPTDEGLLLTAAPGTDDPSAGRANARPAGAVHGPAAPLPSAREPVATRAAASPVAASPAPVSPVAVSPAPVSPVAVSTRSLTRARGGRRVIDELSAEFCPGAMTVVVGRSGTGKTTLLELLAGLAVPDSGRVVLDGRPLPARAEDRAAARRAMIGFLPQEPAPIEFLSAAENIALALNARGVDNSTAHSAACRALRRVGLGERSEQRAGRLSAGEAQRVGLARALACARGLLIVDEPTSRLDDETAAAIAALLAEAAQRDGHTVICATHDPLVISHAHATVTLR